MTTEAQAPAQVTAPRHYDPRLRAVATYPVQQQFVPFARVRNVLADVFGTALSVGTLVNLVRGGSERLQAVEEEIKAALRRAPVLPHDETGLRVVGATGAGLQWTHVTCTPNLTHYARHRARGAGALEAIAQLGGLVEDPLRDPYDWVASALTKVTRVLGVDWGELVVKLQWGHHVVSAQP